GERHQELWSIRPANDEVWNGAGVPDLLDPSQANAGFVHRLQPDQIALEVLALARVRQIFSEDADLGAHQLLGGGAIGHAGARHQPVPCPNLPMRDPKLARGPVPQAQEHSMDLLEGHRSRIEGANDELSFQPPGTSDVADAQVLRELHWPAVSPGLTPAGD